MVRASGPARPVAEAFLVVARKASGRP